MACTTGVRFPKEARKGLFLFATTSRPILGPTQPPVHWVRGPGCETNNLPDHVNAWSYTSTPAHIFRAWCLVWHWDNFTIYFYFIRPSTCYLKPRVQLFGPRPHSDPFIFRLKSVITVYTGCGSLLFWNIGRPTSQFPPTLSNRSHVQALGNLRSVRVIAHVNTL
jgi:hypothetical protein